MSPVREPLTETAVEAWKAFLKANSRLAGELDDELRSEHGYGMGDLDVLAQLEEAAQGSLKMCDLAAAVVMSPSGLSRRVDRLERDGLIQRQRSEGDARNVEARLTSAGKRTLGRLRRSHRGAVQERFADHFDTAEMERLGEYLTRLVPAETEEP